MYRDGELGRRSGSGKIVSCNHTSRYVSGCSPSFWLALCGQLALQGGWV